MAFTIPITVNGKTYNYPVVLVDCDYEYDEKLKAYYNKNLSIGTMYTDVCPLLEFLELDLEPDHLPYSVNITINNQTFSATVKKYGSSPSQIELNAQGTTLAFAKNETMQDNNIWTTGVINFSGSSIVYNYRSGHYSLVGGPTYFFPSANKSPRAIGTKYYYTGKYYKTGLNVKSEKDIIAEEYITSPVTIDTVYGADYYTAQIYQMSGTGITKYLENPNYPKPIPPKYPDNPDDPEDPDNDPTDPTPGQQDPSSDDIPVPPKPTTDVTGTGFVTLYNPSAVDIRNLAYFMWSGEFVDLIKKMFSAPFDALIGLKLLYAPVTTGASQNIWLGNVETDVSSPKITDQFTDFDCGSITISGYYGSFLDYAPYTKVTIFLPFIGYKELNVDEVMDATLHLIYRIDAYSGACIAFLEVTKTIGSTNLKSVVYQFDGNAAMDIPFTSNDMSRYVAAVLNTAASTALSLASGGGSAGLAGASKSAGDYTKEVAPTQPNMKAISNLANGALDVLTTKPKLSRGGSLAGANASMGVKRPYIIIERPMQQMPADYAYFIGIPLNMTKTLSQVTGFTIVSQIFMASTTATEEEINMIEQLLQTGVIL